MDSFIDIIWEGKLQIFFCFSLLL